MSEFHRMITYLYLYEGNRKTHNVGYAKIEKRQAQCRVEIHMKNTGINKSNIPVYFYTQNNNEFPGILLGSMNFTRGTGDFKELLDFADIAPVKGIFLPVSDTEMILSQWDDDTFSRNNFLPPSSVSVLPENPVSPEMPPDEAKTSTAKREICTAKIEAPVSTTKQPDLEAAEVAPDLSREIPENLKAPDDQPLRLEFIIKNFPAVAPFPSESAFEWVQLELKDLRLFPNPYCGLCNNSFLLHGFFNYNHLLLGRKKNTHPSQWVLGIPGVFQNPERVMAAVFGFPEFHSTSETNTKTGQFGYWLRFLE